MKQTVIGCITTSVLLGFMCFNSELFAQSANRYKSPIDSSQIIADRIVQSKTPVLIDFWAIWCGPCKLLNPIISELEKENKGKVLFVKVNVDVHKEISSYFGVQVIPAVFFVYNKNVVKKIPGLQPKGVYSSAIKEILEYAKNTKAAVDTVKK